ncbi:NmrA family NAD(P)-binding protein [Streptomyces sp. TLI_185]|uniref:NmrA family NAD(P)-binding protein n=1 Tax=Streptomyces sp. TLI_185 TaxID=2485151 RepID=UPI001621D61A|nr:NmrA family NAD(P)-binding protein [Streptomyces sp. TLI_185]
MEDRVVTWRVPLGEESVPHAALEDCGFHVRRLFDNPQRADGMDLEAAIEHMTCTDMAAAFEKVTGHPAQYIDTDLDLDAVTAVFTTDWSSGIVEGRVSELKMLKRQMFNRAGLPLLIKRVLLVAASRRSHTVSYTRAA